MMASNLNRRSYLASMEDLSDIESDTSKERTIPMHSFGTSHFFFKSHYILVIFSPCYLSTCITCTFWLIY